MTSLVGILNLTPDSFSDGGQYTTPQQAIAHAKQLIQDGATIIDIGAESTRPDAILLSHEEEWQRLKPILQLTQAAYIPVSLDSYHPETIEKAITYDIAWINDVSGGDNPMILDLAKAHNLPLVIMHHLGIPANREHTIPEDQDPVAIVYAWMEEKLAILNSAGISHDKIILDPGIGFGKTAEQSLAIILRIKELKAFGLPLLVGHSEKSFLSLFTDKPAGQRTAATQIISFFLKQQAVDYLRVHNITANSSALSLAKAYDD